MFMFTKYFQGLVIPLLTISGITPLVSVSVLLVTLPNVLFVASSYCSKYCCLYICLFNVNGGPVLVHHAKF